MIKRNFVDRSKETNWHYTESLVRPYLECCILVWNTYLFEDVKYY